MGSWSWNYGFGTGSEESSYQMGKGNEVAAVRAGGIVDGRGVVAGLSLGEFCFGPAQSGGCFSIIPVDTAGAQVEQLLVR